MPLAARRGCTGNIRQTYIQQDKPIRAFPDCGFHAPPHLNGMMKLVVWYDGGCPLCTREIAMMRRLDRRRAIDFVDVASGDATCPIDRTTLLARFHAAENGTMLSGAAAFAAMWRAIPFLRPLGLAARHPWVMAWLERSYVRFLKVRPYLKKLPGDRPVSPGEG